MHGGYFPGKKEMHFPMDTVEATQPLLNKRRRMTKTDIGKFRCLFVLSSGCIFIEILA